MVIFIVCIGFIILQQEPVAWVVLLQLLMYEFWYDWVKPKYGEKAKLCYMDTKSFIVHIKTNDVFKYIAERFETISDISNYELDRPLPNGKNKKVTGLMKDELIGKIMTKFFRLIAKLT